MRVCMLFLFVFSSFIQAMQSLENIKVIEPKKYPIQERFEVYEMSLKENGHEIGKMQFKVYKGAETICNIDYIYIEEHERKKGNASLLIGIALGKMVQIGCKRVQTQIDSKNEASLELFKKYGFEQKEENEHILGGASLVLQKQL